MVMIKKQINTIILVSILLMVFTTNATALVDYSAQVEAGTDYLKTQQNVDGSIAGFSGITSWATMAFVAAGVGPDTLTYLENNQPASASSATEWSREILAIVAAGENPYNFGGLNYVQGLLAHYSNNQIGGEAYLNDDIFGLLALIAAGDSASPETKDDTLTFIIANQEADGGFGWSVGGGSDVDTTGAALQALIAAMNEGYTHADLDTSILKALTYLLDAQNTDGGFPYTPDDASNTSSTAWAVMALHAAGITTNEYDSAQAYIATNQGNDGSFCWMGCDFGGDTFTSSYAIMALANTTWPIGEFNAEVVVPTLTPSAALSPTPTVTQSETSRTEPTATPMPTVTDEGDVLAGVAQLPETGTGLEVLVFFGVLAMIGVFTKEIL